MMDSKTFRGPLGSSAGANSTSSSDRLSPRSTVAELPIVIAGREVRGEGDYYEIRNPADPTRLVATGRSASRDQIDYAIEAASVAAKMWRSIPGPERGAVLYKAAELLENQVPQLAAALTQEEGKTLSESTAEARRAVETLRFF